MYFQSDLLLKFERQCMIKAHIADSCNTIQTNIEIEYVRWTEVMILVNTRRQAVARIADCTASQHLRGSRDVIDHMTVL